MVDIGAVWDRTVEFVSDELTAVVPIALVGIFVPLSVNASLAPVAVGASEVGKLVIYGAMTLLSLWSLAGSLAVVALGLDPHAGRHVAVKVAGHRLLPAVGISLLTFGAALVAVIPIPAILAWGGFDFAAAANGQIPGAIAGLSGPAGLFVGLYGIALAAVAIWLSARFSVILPTIVMERRGMGVFARSFQLTRGIALKIVGVSLLYVIVSSVAQKATQFVFGTIFSFLFGNNGPMSLAEVLTSIVVGVVATAFAVLAAAFTAKLYRALRDARASIVEAR